MITAKRNSDGSYTVLNGHMRLKVVLRLDGKAQVTDIATNETLWVHEVDGVLLVLSEDAQATLEDLANAAINRARS